MKFARARMYVCVLCSNTFFVQKIEMEILHKIRDSILHQERITNYQCFPFRLNPALHALANLGNPNGIGLTLNIANSFNCT